MTHESFIKFLQNGVTPANADEIVDQFGVFVMPDKYKNAMRWLAYVTPRINQRVKILLAQGKTAEALGLLQLEPER